ncbi:MAG: hypothetical protein ACD_44C00390G0006, partial [uncultured bacterium]
MQGSKRGKWFFVLSVISGALIISSAV